MAPGALWRRGAARAATTPNKRRPLAAPPALLLSLAVALALALALALATQAAAAAPIPPVAVRLSGGVGPLGGFTASASVNGGAPPISLAIDSGSTLTFVEPVQPGRRPLPALGDPLPCDAASCPCDIACGHGCDLPLPAYAVGAFGGAMPKPMEGPRQQKQQPAPPQKQQPAPPPPQKPPPAPKAPAPANSNNKPPPAKPSAAAAAGRGRRLSLMREAPTDAAVQQGAPRPRPSYSDPLGGNASGARCAFDAGYADGGGVEGYLYNAELELGTRGSNGSLPATLIPLGATVAIARKGPGRLPAPLQVADGFVGLGRAPSAFQALLQRSPEVERSLLSKGRPPTSAAQQQQRQQKQQQQGGGNDAFAANEAVSSPADWVGPSSGHVGFCLGSPTGGALLLGGASAADAGRALLPRGAKPAFAPLKRVKEDPWLWSVAGQGVRVVPRLGEGTTEREGPHTRAFAAEAGAFAIAPLSDKQKQKSAPLDARVPAFSFDTGTTSALVVPGAAAFSNLTAAISRAIADANARLPDGAPQRLLPHGELCWLAQGAVATYEGAMARLAAQRAADEIIREVKASSSAAARRRLDDTKAPPQKPPQNQQQPQQQPPASGRSVLPGPNASLASGPPVIKTVLGDDGGRAHGPSVNGHEQRAGPGGSNGQGGPAGANTNGPPLGAGPPPAAIAAAAEKLGGLDAVDDLSLALFPDLVLELAGGDDPDLPPAAPGGRGPRLRRIVVPASSYVLVPRRDRVDIDARFVDIACAAPAAAADGGGGGGGGNGTAPGGGKADDPATTTTGCDKAQREALSALALGRYCALIAPANEAQPATTALVGAAGLRGAGVLLDDGPGEGTLGWAHGVDCSAAYGS